MNDVDADYQAPVFAGDPSTYAEAAGLMSGAKAALEEAGPLELLDVASFFAVGHGGYVATLAPLANGDVLCGLSPSRPDAGEPPYNAKLLSARFGSRPLAKLRAAIDGEPFAWEPGEAQSMLAMAVSGERPLRDDAAVLVAVAAGLEVRFAALQGG